MTILTDHYPLASPRRLSAEAPARAFATVETHRDAGAVLDEWAELEAAAAASVYQTRAFLLPWIETLGAARGIDPLFVVARDAHGRAIALLCLGIAREGAFRIARFLGGKESNFNLGLFLPSAFFAGSDLIALLQAAGKALGADAPDAFVLNNQPVAWEGASNPFAQLPHRPSPSFAYGTALARESEPFLAAKLSKDTRKKLRKKEARLASMGPLALLTNDELGAGKDILDAFFQQKCARCDEQAIEADFSNPAMRAFFDALVRQQSGGKPWLELYALTLGGRAVATYAGAVHRGRFSAMVNSFDMDPEIAKSSPGELLLVKLLAAQCAKGSESFDLGIGEARYKATYCDITLPLFDVVIPLNAKGRVFAAFDALRGRLKFALKRNPELLAKLRHWRRFLSRFGRGAPARGA